MLRTAVPPEVARVFEITPAEWEQVVVNGHSDALFGLASLVVGALDSTVTVTTSQVGEARRHGTRLIANIRGQLEKPTYFAQFHQLLAELDKKL